MISDWSISNSVLNYRVISVVIVVVVVVKKLLCLQNYTQIYCVKSRRVGLAKKYTKTNLSYKRRVQTRPR